MTAESEQPILTVVAGTPTEEELAAVIAVFAARPAVSAKPRKQFNLWARRSRFTRPVQRPGYGAWRGSMLPR